MGSISERNLSFLQRIQPKLAHVLGQCVPNGSVADIPVNECTKRNIDGADPGRHYRELGHGQPVLYLEGLGHFRETAAILERLPSVVRFVVVLEPDRDVVTSFLDRVPVFDILRGRTLVFVMSEETHLLDEAVHAAFGRSGFLVGRRAMRLRLEDAASHGAAGCDLLRAAFMRALSYQIENLGNSPEDSLLGLRQMALSSPWTLFSHKLSVLEGRFKQWPAVIVSAGPSLDRNLHLLKGLEEKIVIIAVDTVLGKLLKSGIVPHFVTSLERGSLVYDAHFRGIIRENPPELKNVVLVVQSVCVPGIAGKWPGPVIVAGKRDIVLDREIVGGVLGGSVIASGSSVSHMGLGLANHIGVPAVALIGQDLAFADDGRSHADRTYWDEHSVDAQTPLEDRCTVPAARGGTVETTRIWRYFIEQFTRMASEMPIPLHDCTEGGALIPGAVTVDLSRFLAGNIPGDKAGNASAFLKSILDDSASRNVDVNEFDRRYATLQQSLHRSRQSIDAALALLRSLDAPVATSQRRETLIREVRKTLNRLTTESPILTYIGQAQFASLIAESYALQDLSDKPTLMQWIGRHREFLENQAVSVEMIVGWLLYIDGVRQMMPEVMNALRMTDPESLLRDMCSGTPSGTFREAIIWDILLSRTELSGFVRDPAVAEKIARHFMNEKRFSEAAGVLSDLLGTRASFSRETGSALWVLLASCFMNADLCWPPEHEKAHGALSRAYLENPDNRDVERTLGELLDKQRKLAEHRAGGSDSRTAEHMKKRASVLRENMRLLRKSPQEALKRLLGIYSGDPVAQNASTVKNSLYE